jgi:hypothetical protein
MPEEGRPIAPAFIATGSARDGTELRKAAMACVYMAPDGLAVSSKHLGSPWDFDRRVAQSRALLIETYMPSLFWPMTRSRCRVSLFQTIRQNAIRGRAMRVFPLRATGLISRSTFCSGSSCRHCSKRHLLRMQITDSIRAALSSLRGKRGAAFERCGKTSTTRLVLALIGKPPKLPRPVIKSA